ncbi:MAG: 23S rRNA (pseudouridine(1915)-N(3))-methyltransferase RlmH [Thermodesulfobacteriota bacterium]
MRLKFVFVGRTKSRYLAQGVSDYLTRLKAYLPVEEVIVKDVRGRDEAAREVRAEETQRLLATLKPDDFFVLLDSSGREMTSLELATWLKETWDRGVKSLVFGLGGPQGLDERAIRRADLKLSLSRLTLTHEMCRLVLLEQIYRGLRLATGRPYHK